MTRKTAIPSSQKTGDLQWCYDDDLWLDLIRELDDEQVEHAARLLHKLINEIQKPDGAFHVRCCLENGRRVVFSHTRFFNDCKLLFIESLDEAGPMTVAELLDRKRQA
jgi:hypothetical protein